MYNSFLTGVLGVALVLCLGAAKFVSDAQDSYKQTQAYIAQLDAQTATLKMGENAFLKKYDLNELKKHYPAPTVKDGKTLIPVPVINQFPELPTGCEITSAAALLNYIGYDVEKVQLQEQYLPSSASFYTANGSRMGPDPAKFFIGDPKGKGLGCFSTVIVESLNRFLLDQGSQSYAVNVVNADSKTLEILLDNGIPVEVWASRGMKPFVYTAGNEWVLETTGERFRWPSNSHVLVLVGYDKENYYFADCDNKSGIQAYEKSLFLKRWESAGQQAVLIKIK